MKLLIILLAWFIEHFAGVTDAVRNLEWFPRYVRALENRCNRYSLWNGPAGVVLTLALPVLVLALLLWILLKLFYPLAIVLSLVCLLYALGPGFVHARLDDYIHALEEGDTERIRQLSAGFVPGAEAQAPSDRQVLEGVLLYANHRLFAILFWFMVLGPCGAVLYRLSGVLLQEYREIHGDYAEAVKDLLHILAWPSSRLFALGNALSGNMVDALEGWREVEEKSLQVNEEVVRASGMGALNYRPDEGAPDQIEDRVYWLHVLQGMLNRTLLLWLTILGLMTLAGWMG